MSNTGLALAIFMLSAAGVAWTGEIVLFDAASTPLAAVSSQSGGVFALKDGVLEIETKGGAGYPGILVKGEWDLSECGRITLDLAHLDDFKLPEGIDKPVVIGEFHFGALDRGLFHPGLIRLDSQAERGSAYVRYVTSALRHPNVVGVHWHQFGDQATTGRFDGENFQVGFVDCCDTPYPETIAGLREVGYGLYDIRAGRNGK